MFTLWYADQILANDGAVTVSGQVLSYTYSLIPGTASGGGGLNATANGTTFSYSFSIIAGTASADSEASGQVLGYSYSLISGTASGQANATASGIVLSEIYSLLAGSASANTPNATANGVTFGYSYSLISGLAQGGLQNTVIGGAFGPSGKKYYRRYDVYNVEADLVKVAESAQRSTSRKGRKQQLAKVQRSLGDFLSRVEPQSELPLSVLDLRAAYDASISQAAQDFAYAQWKDNVLRSVNQALIELRLQIEIIEEEDNDMLLMVL
jgi:cation transport regulator ChaB